MKFRIDKIADAIKEEISRYAGELEIAQIGRVLDVGDGIARIYGLSGAMAGEMIVFENDTIGQVFNLEENFIGAVILGDDVGIKEGDTVRGTGSVLSVPVGEGLVGRVVDPLGRPIDDAGAIDAADRRPVEIVAPGIADREPVSEPLANGIKAIDSMAPIGRGQRELIIGDRKTGKTTIAVDTIINQKGTGILCVYVAIGQKESTIAAVVDALNEHGAMEHTIVVAAGSASAAPLQYIAPYAGCAMAEYFMYAQGRDTLCIYDDLSKQAAAYRQLSLLLRRPPGREAYPGDVFYLHSRLLERAVKLARRWVLVPRSAPDEEFISVTDKEYVGIPGLREAEQDLGEMGETHELRKVPASGGSLTALPIVETLEGEVSAYIPTNAISITDGQIYLEPDLFYAGVRPAINVGISVSRVGGKAQIPAMKKVAGSLRLDLAAYRELEAFAQLGTELEPATQRQLDRGRAMVELLKQNAQEPYHVVDQVVSLLAGTRGYLDDLSTEQIRSFERGLLEEIRDRYPEIREELMETGALSDALVDTLEKAIADFKNAFLAEW
jgi:F-type H+/Na+-transporting ATPase subunit alpha